MAANDQHGPRSAGALFVIASMLGGCAATTGSDGRTNEAALLGMAVDVPVEPPTPSDPVSLGAAVWPEQAAEGDVILVVIRAEIAPGWHVYGSVRPGTSSVPLTLTLTSADALTPIGSWSAPASSADPVSGHSLLAGVIEYRRLFRVASDFGAFEGSDISVTVTYQARNAATQHPPTAKNVVAHIHFARDT